MFSRYLNFLSLPDGVFEPPFRFHVDIQVHGKRGETSAKDFSRRFVPSG